MKPPKTLEWLYNHIEHVYEISGGSGKGTLGVNYILNNEALFAVVDIRTFADKLINAPYANFKEQENKYLIMIDDLLKDVENYKNWEQIK